MKHTTHRRGEGFRRSILSTLGMAIIAASLCACEDSSERRVSVTGADAGDDAAEQAAQAPGQSTGQDADLTAAPDSGGGEAAKTNQADQSEPDMSAQHASPRDPAKANRLVNESSPYLLQHAYNPVDWRPWGEEAFAAARAQNKPIFLSVGYSTCYWCHVMERESFEDETVAALMNEHFICIKVDREERPDVDDIYMVATQTILNGRGGWPMSVFLEPATLKPFHAGTYFPRPSFMQILQSVNTAWLQQQDAVVAQADQVANIVRGRLQSSGSPVPLDPRIAASASSRLMATYDVAEAGFGPAPKFPQPCLLELQMGVAWDDPAVQSAVLHTLDRMAMGGMYDQIGGGFHRYSTDRFWLVPHFEKMTYDNGQLASVYADAYERTRDPYYAEIVRETIEYILREMMDDRGAFFSAQDAEVDAREGLNYLWLQGEIEQVLRGADLEADIPFALDVYGFNKGTNFTDPHHPEDGPKNVVYLVEKPAVKARALGIDLDELNVRVERINAALLVVRDTRKQPGTDDKVLAGWNGLMIAGMADGGRVLGESSYVEAAARAAEFVLTVMRGDDGGLLRIYREGSAKVPAFLEDYAYMTRGLIALYRATGDQQHIEHAGELMRLARERFWDDARGGYFDTLAGQSDLFVRTKSYYDGAVPCGNSVMILSLLDLHEITGNESYLDDAASALNGLSDKIAQQPVGTALCTLALHRISQSNPGRLASVGGGPATSPFTNTGTAVQGKVAVAANADAVTIGADATATVQITLTIAETYHINAHEPGQEGFIGLEVLLVDGAGVEIDVTYPEGELFDDAIRVHTGSVTVPITIKRTGDVTGSPHLQVSYQTCSGKVCYLPKTDDIPVELKFTN